MTDEQPRVQSIDFQAEMDMSSRRSIHGRAKSDWCKSVDKDIKDVSNKVWNEVLRPKSSHRSNIKELEESWRHCFETCGSGVRGKFLA
jgi:hypothetical protein